MRVHEQLFIPRAEPYFGLDSSCRRRKNKIRAVNAGAIGQRPQRRRRGCILQAGRQIEFLRLPARYPEPRRFDAILGNYIGEERTVPALVSAERNERVPNMGILSRRQSRIVYPLCAGVKPIFLRRHKPGIDRLRAAVTEALATKN